MLCSSLESRLQPVKSAELRLKSERQQNELFLRLDVKNDEFRAGSGATGAEVSGPTSAHNDAVSARTALATHFKREHNFVLALLERQRCPPTAPGGDGFAIDRDGDGVG